MGGAGRVTAVLPAQGREHIPVQAQRDGDGHTYVIPQDATALVLDGTVDRRLFDVTELSRPAFRALHGDALPFIVRYEDGDEDDDAGQSGPGENGPGAGQRLRAAAGDADVHPLRSIGADALATGPGDTAAAWSALTRPSGGGGGRTAAPGVASLRLDGLVRAALDRSVRQIGAPAAWETGREGEGVTIAVVDSGIDTAHPDLSGGKVVAAKNFSASPGATDRYGHGTHVASIAAGTGAASGGTYRGVAPAARLLNAKVIGDDNSGTESSVIAGMEWAVGQGADVVNLSVGTGDTPGVGPMEEAVNRLSEESGALFVAAAGNAGPRPRSISSPGSAEAALTVGAVDREDRLAGFSSVGPRTGDGGLKPDLTAPGVSIGAALAEGSVLAGEAGPVADGYGSLSGTSMAAPHAAGAAALLAERHPDWSGGRIKAALTGAAAAGRARASTRRGRPARRGPGRRAEPRRRDVLRRVRFRALAARRRRTGHQGPRPPEHGGGGPHPHPLRRGHGPGRRAGTRGHVRPGDRADHRPRGRCRLHRADRRHPARRGSVRGLRGGGHGERRRAVGPHGGRRDARGGVVRPHGGDRRPGRRGARRLVRHRPRLRARRIHGHHG
ncbi:S8 family serine peptidase [Streptomyces sp. MNU89]|uniref:S8 family serine peptidase n=1 Tax=Streptomyces sp. MNU89 TaxID=2560025 RepID=UPI001E455B63|nr:S8 family serine peptidase [Streptomyces sp. MNU89]MCC9738238.1 S8 family serine peptidase [Streptomyces sp. MNU89]